MRQGRRLPALLRIAGCLRVTGAAARLRLLGFGRVARPLMGGPSKAAARSASNAMLVMAQVAVGASGRLPWSTCLTRSVALAEALRRRGIPAVLRLGVALPAAGFESHAWVEVAGRSVGEPDAAHDHFTVMDQL